MEDTKLMLIKHTQEAIKYADIYLLETDSRKKEELLKLGLANGYFYYVS